MKSARSLLLTLGFAATGAALIPMARAQQKVSPAKLRSDEARVRVKAAGELVALAKSCAAAHA